MASGPAINTTVLFTPGQTGFSATIVLNLTDDQYALEAIETYQLTIVIPQTTRGVVPGVPITTVVNILDDDGT